MALGQSLPSNEGRKKAIETQLLLLPYHAISPPKGSQQMEHSKGPPGAPLPDHRMWHPREAAGGGKAPSSLAVTDWVPVACQTFGCLGLGEQEQWMTSSCLPVWSPRYTQTHRPTQTPTVLYLSASNKIVIFEMELKHNEGNRLVQCHKVRRIMSSPSQSASQIGKQQGETAQTWKSVDQIKSQFYLPAVW